MSLHQTGFQEVLALAELMGQCRAKLLLIGVQPVELDDFGGSLREAVKAQIEPALDIALRTSPASVSSRKHAPIRTTCHPSRTANSPCPPTNPADPMPPRPAAPRRTLPAAIRRRARMCVGVPMQVREAGGFGFGHLRLRRRGAAHRHAPGGRAGARYLGAGVHRRGARGDRRGARAAGLRCAAGTRCSHVRPAFRAPVRRPDRREPELPSFCDPPRRRTE